MRLDRLKIGSDLDHPSHQFKNLKNVCIDFDQNHWITVVIGWNGTGKSNVLEALAIIFRDLIEANKTPAFAYELTYRIGHGDAEKKINIIADPTQEKKSYTFKVSEKDLSAPEFIDVQQQMFSDLEEKKSKEVSFRNFTQEDSPYLPRFVFSYYSGLSQRMEKIFQPYIQKYDKKLRGGQTADEIGFKRMFYALPIHSQFVLLAFLFKQDQVVKDFLQQQLGIDPESGLESILFELRQPSWNSKSVDGDMRLWNARGVVRDFIAEVYDIALAPIKISRTAQDGSWNKKNREYLYLFLKDMQAFEQLVIKKDPKSLFRDLESTYVSELIEAVHIRVKLQKNDGTVTFKELSEGEQQLLTVLGLLRFTSGEESLFLLDEPDTHLNPRWSVEYLKYLEQFVSGGDGEKKTSHIVLTTHNPLAIAELDREQVQILRMIQHDGDRQIVACYPEMAPRGMGYAAIVTSDMFGIASSLDQTTQELLEAQRAFAAKDRLTSEEQGELDIINSQLDRLGFRFFHPDDEYSRYLRLRNHLLIQQFENTQPTELAKQVVQMPRTDREALAKRLIAELLTKDPDRSTGA